METKICSKCKQEKSVGEFSRDKHSKDDLRRICKKCDIQKNKQYRAENKEKIKEKNKQYYAKNAEKLNENKKQYRAENPEKIKDGKLRYKYGITLEKYNVMSQEQGNACLICKQEKKLVVDHCHDTGIVRGLLCSECNTAIGLLKETTEYFVNAIEYLQKFSNQFEERIVA